MEKWKPVFPLSLQTTSQGGDDRSEVGRVGGDGGVQGAQVGDELVVPAGTEDASPAGHRLHEHAGAVWIGADSMVI